MDNFFAFAFLLSIPLLIIGIISPKTISKWARRELSRKTISLSLSGFMIFSFLMFGILMDPVTTNPSHNSDIASKAQNQIEEATSPMFSENEVKEEISHEPESTNSEQGEAQGENLHLVTKVVDGDTIDVNINGSIKRLRLIGLDRPETKDPRKSVECFGHEASKKTTELLLNQKVSLEADPSQGELDKYGRLLRYVHREDGLFFNKWMIENGYAHEYTYNSPYTYQKSFKEAQKYATDNKLGLWAEGACKNFAVEPNKETNTQIPVTKEEATEVQKEEIANTACNIKGNISSDGRKLYHAPYCPSYNRTKINESNGERWFCSEEEAVKAGWTKAGNC